MCKKLICLCSFVFVLGLFLPNVANAADPSLMGWWKFDGDARDSSGNGRDGTLNGDPQSVAGVYGYAMNFDGDDYVSIPGYKGVLGTHAFSISAWVMKGGGGGARTIIAWGQLGSGSRVNFRFYGSGQIRLSTWDGRVQSEINLSQNVWHHVAVTKVKDQTQARLYIDGQDVTSGNYSINSLNIVADADVCIGWDPVGQGDYCVGSIDDVLIYDKELTEEDVVRIIGGDILLVSTVAYNPKPANEETYVLRDAALSWTPGDFANTHDVYLGTSFEDVNTATTASPEYKGNQSGTTYALDRLDFGQTYYWRVDEVNAPPDNTIFKGNIWSFTVEPVGYPIAAENITTTASSSNSPDEGPENTINGSGLDDDGLHSAESIDMWLSSVVDPAAPWIQYEFDRVYKLHQMLVWNHNTSFELALGFGIKEAVIEYSADGTNWTALGTTHEFTQAPGAAGYAASTTIDLGSIAAEYIKITPNSNWGGFVPQYGLSEVRFLYIPVSAREPNPASDATDTGVDNVTLSWRAGREAATHNVYFSSDEQAVIDGTADVTTVTEPSHGPLSLDLAQTYYWRVDEVNEAETPTTWQGNVWNFTTQEYLVVDDFESYNDLDPTDPESRRIFNVWKDGYQQPTNGSLVGYENPPFCEQTIVHDGKQSMPFHYDNSAAAFSEATASIANLPIGQDWTKYDIKALTLWFYGDPNNIVTEQMYVKVSSSKVVYDGDLSDITKTSWQQWNIELADFAGVNLNNVTDLSIGLERSGGAGSKGVVYIDAIRLYPYSREPIALAEPDNASLVGH